MKVLMGVEDGLAQNSELPFSWRSAKLKVAPPVAAAGLGTGDG